jgi:uncharacterized protein (TIGR00369 family)
MKKQPNSRLCFVCGLDNPIGLKLAFYEDEQGHVAARFTPQSQHQGYPGVVHGGIVTALLDEVLARVAIGSGRWVMTARLNLRYRRPIPLDQPLTVVGQALGWKRSLFEARGQIILADGQVGAEAEGTFAEVRPEQVEQLAGALGFWEVVPDAEPPDFSAWQLGQDKRI